MACSICGSDKHNRRKCPREFNPLICEICGETEPTKEKLRIHTINSCGKKPIVDEYGQKIGTQIGQLEEEKSDVKYVRCDSCGCYPVAPNALICQFCGDEFVYPFEYIYNIKTKKK